MICKIYCCTNHFQGKLTEKVKELKSFFKLLEDATFCNRSNQHHILQNKDFIHALVSYLLECHGLCK